MYVECVHHTLRDPTKKKKKTNPIGREPRVGGMRQKDG